MSDFAPPPDSFGMLNPAPGTPDETFEPSYGQAHSPAWKKTLDIYSLMKPHQIAAHDIVAGGLARRSSIDYYKSDRYKLMSVEEISQEEDQLRSAKVIEKLNPAIMKLDDSQYQMFRQQMEQEMASMPKVPGQANLHTPSVLQAAVAILGGIMNPRHSSDIMATPFQEQLRQQGIATQEGRQSYEAQIAARQERMRYVGQMMGTSLDMAKDERDSNVSLAKTNIGIERENIDNQRQDEFRLKSAEEQRSAKAWQAYEKDPSETNAARLRKLDPEFAPTPEAVVQDMERKNRANVKSALQEWDDALSTHLDAYGNVDPKDEPRLESARQAIAKAFGVDPAALMPAKSGATLAREKHEQKKSEFAANLKFKEGAHRDNLAVKKANLEIAKERLKVSQRLAEAAISRGFGQLEVSRYNSELSAYRASAKGFDTEIEKDISAIDQKIANQRGRMNGLTGDKLASEQMKLDGLVSEKAFIESQREGAAGPLLEGVFGGMGFQMPAPAQPQQAPKPNVPGAPWATGTIGGGYKVAPSKSSKVKATGKPVQRKVKQVAPVTVKMPKGWKLEGF
jgi:hypothetical protein